MILSRQIAGRTRRMIMMMCTELNDFKLIAGEQGVELPVNFCILIIMVRFGCYLFNRRKLISCFFYLTSLTNNLTVF